MSIITGRGDEGKTDLMYGTRIAKTHPRVEAYGTIDELNTCIGLARATCQSPDLIEIFPWLQKQLVNVMGELATSPADRDRYQTDGYEIVTDQHTEEITEKSKTLESKINLKKKGWTLPGEIPCLGSCHLDVARTTTRRAERNVWILIKSAEEPNEKIALWLNRLSDFFWIAARIEEDHFKLSN